MWSHHQESCNCCRYDEKLLFLTHFGCVGLCMYTYTYLCSPIVLCVHTCPGLHVEEILVESVLSLHHYLELWEYIWVLRIEYPFWQQEITFYKYFNEQNLFSFVQSFCYSFISIFIYDDNI